MPLVSWPQVQRLRSQLQSTDQDSQRLLKARESIGIHWYPLVSIGIHWSLLGTWWTPKKLVNHGRHESWKRHGNHIELLVHIDLHLTLASWAVLVCRTSVAPCRTVELINPYSSSNIRTEKRSWKWSQSSWRRQFLDENGLSCKKIRTDIFFSIRLSTCNYFRIIESLSFEHVFLLIWEWLAKVLQSKLQDARNLAEEVPEYLSVWVFIRHWEHLGIPWKKPQSASICQFWEYLGFSKSPSLPPIRRSAVWKTNSRDSLPGTWMQRSRQRSDDMECKTKKNHGDIWKISCFYLVLWQKKVT